MSDTTRPIETTESEAPGAAPRGNGFALAALVVGIIAMSISFIPIVNNVAFVLGLVALGLAIPAFLKTRKGSRGKGQTVAAVILSVLAMITTLGTQALFVSAIDDVTTEISQELEAADEAVQVELGTAASDGFGTTLEVTITNVGSETLTGGLVTIQAVDASGVVLEEGFASVPQLEPGQSAAEDAVFFEDLPADVTYVVVDTDGFTF